MVAPLVAAAGISAGASLLGGLLGSRSQSRANEANARLQREFAQHGIRWRVADAKAAGLHPLYALGGQLPGFSPSFQMDPMGQAIANAGQDISRAVALQQTAEQRAAADLGTQLIQAQIRESDARTALLDSERMRMSAPGQPGQINWPSGVTTYPLDDNAPPGQLDHSWVSGQPQAQDFWDPSVARQAAQPLWVRYQVTRDGPNLYLPGGLSGDASEALESLGESPTLMWMVYQENVRRSGQAFADEIFRTFAPNWFERFKQGFDESAKSTNEALKEFLSTPEGRGYGRGRQQ